MKEKFLMCAFKSKDKKVVISCQKFLDDIENNQNNEKKISSFRQIISRRLENNVEVCRELKNIMTIMLYENIGTC